MREAIWKEYELIDTSNGERLERWGDKILIRPDPQKMLMQGITAQKQAAAVGKYIKNFRRCGMLPTKI